MALEGAYSEEVQAMQLEIEPFLAVGDGLRTPAQKEAIERWAKARFSEEYEDPALRVRVNRQSPILEELYGAIDVQPSVLFDLLEEEAGLPKDVARTSYLYFAELDTGVSRYPQNDRVHTHISVGLYKPFMHARDVTKEKVANQEKEVAKHAPTDNEGWMTRWRTEQYIFENKRILQAEVSKETARMMMAAVHASDEKQQKAYARRQQINKAATVGGIAGLSYLTAGNSPEVILCGMAYGVTWLAGVVTLRQAGIYIDPLDRQEHRFAREVITDPDTRQRFADAVTVKPA